MTPVEKLLKVARNEIGYLEKATNANLDDKTANAGNNNWNKYARDLDKTDLYNTPKNGYSWCDIWCDWCFVTAFGFEKALAITGQAKKGVGAGCTGSANYYKAKGWFYKSNPQPGDQIFFTDDNGKSFYHTGIVEKVTTDRIYTIEGNTSSSVGVVANGGAVRDKSYPYTYKYIGGFGRPNYSLIGEVISSTLDTSTTPKNDTLSGTVTAKSGLRSRSGPSSVKYGQVGAFNYGANLIIHEEQNGFYRVTGTSGWGNLTDVWVDKKYVTVLPSTSNTVTERTGIVTAKSGLIAKNGPGSLYMQVGALNYGANVTIHETKNGWHKISGTSGWGDLKNVWVNATYVKIIS